MATREKRGQRDAKRRQVVEMKDVERFHFGKFNVGMGTVGMSKKTEAAKTVIWRKARLGCRSHGEW
jgi:hypothetical protein